MGVCGKGPAGSFLNRVLYLLSSASLLLTGQMLIGCAPAPETNWLGIDVRLSRPPATSQPASTPVASADENVDFGLMKELGVAQLRIDLMNWSKIQPTADGRYDFSSSDQIVRLAQQNGIEILAVCNSVPPWAAATPATGLPASGKTPAFTAFVRAFVERYDGDSLRDMPGLRRPIRTYECFAEMENAPTADYAACLKLFHETVKGVCPKATVVLGSLTSPGVLQPGRPTGGYHTYFERLLAEPALEGPHYPCFDVVGFRSFPRLYPGRPPFEHAVIYLHQAMAARRIDRPLWLTGFGANSNEPNTGGEERQAADLVCWAIHARTLGIERLYLYTLHDDSQAKGANAFGVLRAAGPSGHPVVKPAFQALTILLGILRTQGHVTRRAEGVYMLSGQQEPTYVLWKVASYDPPSFLLPDWWSIRTLNGQETIRQGADIKLGSQPIFLQRTRSPFIR